MHPDDLESHPSSSPFSFLWFWGDPKNKMSLLHNPDPRHPTNHFNTRLDILLLVSALGEIASSDFEKKDS
jgi:hypothetical protein